MAQNLDSMPVSKRDSFLISIAKEVVLKYGPDYYREYSKPIIERHVVPPKGEINITGEMAGKVFYQITYLYDKAEETLNWNYAAKVSIWADTGNPIRVYFGNNIGRSIPEGMDWRNANIEPIPYFESTFPIYDPGLNISIPDSITGNEARVEYYNKTRNAILSNPDPVNKEELIRKGFEKNSEGKWVRRTPAVPPAKAQRAIERAKEEVRRARNGQ
jgi:hypothetical protein